MQQILSPAFADVSALSSNRTIYLRQGTPGIWLRVEAAESSSASSGVQVALLQDLACRYTVEDAGVFYRVISVPNADGQTLPIGSSVVWVAADEGAAPATGPSFQTLVGVAILTGAGPGSGGTIIWANESDAAVDFAGAKLWPVGTVVADPTDYMVMSITVYPTLDQSDPASATTVSSFSTETDGWTPGVPRAFVGSAFSVPAGGSLAFAFAPVGAGQSLPAFTLRLH